MGVSQRVGWQPVLSGELATAAVASARDVSNRLTSLKLIEEAVAASATQTAFPRSTHWVPYTISQGYSGLALLWAYLDACFPQQRWDLTGRQHLELAARGAEAASGIPPGLFSGLSGLALSAWQLSRNGTRYQRLLNNLDQEITAQANVLAQGMLQPQDGIGVGDFDVISGLSGVGAYLLCRREKPEGAAALACVTEALVQLMENDQELPHWHTPVHLLWDNEIMQMYPHGNLNCGLAHGVPGVLAFLSLAFQNGSQVPGLKRAITRTADWLCQSRCDDQAGVNWPTAVPLEEVQTPNGTVLLPGSPQSDGPSRAAWCYGSPGIARSLWLAGEAVECDKYCELAVSAMEAIFRRPVADRRIDSPTFCHGVAGLLQIALRFANDTGKSVFVDESCTLVRQILEHYRPESLLGFRNLETADHEIDQPGLLDGAPGVALVLLAAATNVEPTWDRLFLLS